MFPMLTSKIIFEKNFLSLFKVSSFVWISNFFLSILLPRINPVTGHVEPPKVSPFEGMTEEQKEYEANR